ncbi:MAG: type II toxin-antitoxin system RelE/ParE family toxin [Candidatus Aminicenantaceae bacterium]
MNLYLTRTFQKRFSKLPKTIQSKIEGALKEIYLDPYSGKRLLGELEGEFSFRVGTYRIIYCIDEQDNIWIETVRHRKNTDRR